jgi:hypothetical protein
MEAGLESFPPVAVVGLPADPGPIPGALVDRAVRTLRRMAEAEAELDDRRADIARELIGLAAAARGRGDHGRPQGFALPRHPRLASLQPAPGPCE